MVSLRQLCTKVVDILLALLTAMFIIFETIPGGRYLYLMLSAVILLLGTLGRFEIRLQPWHIFNLLMIGFTAASTLWSLNSGLTMEMTKRQLVTFLCFAMINIGYLESHDSIWGFLHAFKWSGWIVALYVIARYGLSSIIAMLNGGVRMGKELGNPNLIAMAVAYGVMIHLLELFRNKKVLRTAFMIVPEMLVILASQSRKALLIPILGVVMGLFMYSNLSKRKITALVKIVFGMAIFLMIASFLSKLPAFEGIMNRMMFLVNSITGEGEVGGSIESRKQLIQVGMEQFYKTPLLGIGIATAIKLTMYGFVHPYDYLHNNYVELLACGGALGTCIYYSRYVYLMWMYYRYRKQDTDGTIPCVIMMVVILVMDYAHVTYYIKSDQIQILMLFMQVELIQKRNQRKIAEHAGKYIRHNSASSASF